MQLSLWIFNFQALGGGNEIQIYHQSQKDAERIAELAIHEVKNIEEKYSRYLPNSIVSRINAAAGLESIEVDAETAALLDYSNVCYLQSEGLFDITSGIFRRVWDFKTPRIPTEVELATVLDHIGWEKVSWEKPKFRLNLKGMEIDFGGIGKEFAVDKIAGILLTQGIKHALINLGGDVRAIGPHPDGSAWRIGIRHPRDDSKTISSMEITSGALATSGDYERFFEIDGKRYCHILNPKTGYPVESFQSVTVVAESCLVAGSISTISMLLGKKKGLKFLKNSGKKYFLYPFNSN